MKTVKFLFLAVIAVFFESSLFSAPMIPIGPMNIEGTIETVTWQPEQFIKGQTVNMDGKDVPLSGTLGADRRIVAKYQVKLIDTIVEKPSGVDNPYYKSLPSGAPISATIYHDKDDGYLKKGMRIKIFGYQIGGDEGATWSSYKEIEILKDVI